MRIIMVIALAAGSVVAAPIVDLSSTGQNNVGGIDKSWTINGGQAFVTDQSLYPFPLWGKSSSASWISPQAEYDGVSDPADTTFKFSTTFNLPSTSSQLSFRCGLDPTMACKISNSTGLLSDISLP